MSGFAMRSESEFDPFGAGHASTSISAALGMATARDLHGGKETVVAVIGDGALTGGLAYEAINNAGPMKTNFIVILNDNEMSIAPNVGSIASYLSVLRSKPWSNQRARTCQGRARPRAVRHDRAPRVLDSAETAAMKFVSPEGKTAVIFEEMGFRYIGPIDGHDYDALCDIISNARRIPGPVLLHVRTVKGKGFEPAESDARTFHGVGPNVYSTRRRDGSRRRAARPTFAQAFADALIAVAARDPRDRHYRRDARRYRACEVRQGVSGALFRRRHRRSARGVFRRRRVDQRHQAGVRDLLDVLAARLRSDRPRRRACRICRSCSRSIAPASSVTTARRTWGSTTSPTCARCRT